MPTRVLHCKRCDYEWMPHKEVTPVMCPHCHSSYWNKDRVRKGNYRTKKSDPYGVFGSPKRYTKLGGQI